MSAELFQANYSLTFPILIPNLPHRAGNRRKFGFGELGSQHGNMRPNQRIVGWRAGRNEGNPQATGAERRQKLYRHHVHSDRAGNVREELRKSIPRAGGPQGIHPGTGETYWTQERSTAHCAGKGAEFDSGLGGRFPFPAGPERGRSGLPGAEEQGYRVSNHRSRFAGADLYTTAGRLTFRRACCGLNN